MIKIIDKEIEILELELLRYKAFGIDKDLKQINDTYYSQKLKEGKILGIAYYDENNKIVSGCYITNCFNNILLDMLFTEENKRKKGIATNLIKYIEKNKSKFEKYYSTKFNSIILESKEESREFYIENGFIEQNSIYMKKKLHKKK